MWCFAMHPAEADAANGFMAFQARCKIASCSRKESPSQGTGKCLTEREPSRSRCDQHA